MMIINSRFFKQLAILAGAGAMCTGCMLTPAEPSKQAEINYKNGDYSKAIVHYDSLIDSNPEAADAYLKRALSRVQVKDIDGAIDDLSKYTSLRPKDPEGYIIRGKLFQTIKRNHRAALKDFRQAIALNPNNGEAFYWEGNSLHSLEQLQDALVSMNIAIKLEPEAAGAYYARGNVYESIN